jgi:phosphate-selective porin OprO/OprP
VAHEQLALRVRFGVAGTTGKASGPLRGYSSPAQVTTFSFATTVTANGDRRRWSPQAWFFLGPVGFLAEYVEVHHDVQRVEASKPTVTGALKNSAWSVTGSWLVTGEDATYGNVKPKDFFVPSAGKWGSPARRACQPVEGRRDHARGFADATRSVREARAGVGLNWIWNNNLKYVLDYEQTRFKGGAAGNADRPTEKIIQTRLQLSYERIEPSMKTPLCPSQSWLEPDLAGPLRPRPSSC